MIHEPTCTQLPSLLQRTCEWYTFWLTETQLQTLETLTEREEQRILDC